MSGSRSALIGFALCGLSGFPSSARADESIPGGWAPQVGFQSFESPGSFHDSRMRNDGSFGSGRNATSGGVGGFPAGPISWDLSGMAAKPQVVNGLVPLAGVVRRQSRNRPRR